MFLRLTAGEIEVAERAMESLEEQERKACRKRLESADMEEGVSGAEVAA